MSEDKTFNKLRRCNLDELEEYISNIKRVPPLISLSGMTYDTRNYLGESQRYIDMIRCIESHGWTIEDYYIALEKRTIRAIVKEYNDNIVFPQEIIDRAKVTFPNIEFRHAVLDLKEENNG